MSIKSERLKSGLKVSDVMAAIGVSDAAVYQWETGEYTPRPDKLIKLAKLFNCTVDDLLKKEEQGGDKCQEQN